jgi:hypothetical protein
MTEETPGPPPIKQRGIDNADMIAPAQERDMLPVSWEQWDRLKTRVAELGNPRVDMVNYEAAAWGVCVPCAISFVLFVTQDNRPAWSLLVYGIVAVASFVLGLAFRHFQRQEGAIRHEDAANIVDEMTVIEQARQRRGRDR